MVTPGNEGVVHHIIIYRCFNGTVFSTGYEGSCHGNMPDEHFRCRASAPILAWGIGGNVKRISRCWLMRIISVLFFLLHVENPISGGRWISVQRRQWLAVHPLRSALR